MFIISVHLFLCVCVSDGMDMAAPAKAGVRFGRVVSQDHCLYSYLGMKLIPCNSLSTAGLCHIVVLMLSAAVKYEFDQEPSVMCPS